MTDFYDLVKGPKLPEEPDPYNVKWEDEARAAATEDNPVPPAGGQIAIAGTPLTPIHYFDARDGEVTATPVLTTA